MFDQFLFTVPRTESMLCFIVSIPFQLGNSSNSPLLPSRCEVSAIGVDVLAWFFIGKTVFLFSNFQCRSTITRQKKTKELVNFPHVNSSVSSTGCELREYSTGTT